MVLPNVTMDIQTLERLLERLSVPEPGRPGIMTVFLHTYNVITVNFHEPHSGRLAHVSSSTSHPHEPGVVVNTPRLAYPSQCMEVHNIFCISSHLLSWSAVIVGSSLISKSDSRKCLSVPFRPATTDPQQIKVKFPYSLFPIPTSTASLEGDGTGCFYVGMSDNPIWRDTLSLGDMLLFCFRVRDIRIKFQWFWDGPLSRILTSWKTLFKKRKKSTFADYKLLLRTCIYIVCSICTCQRWMGGSGVYKDRIRLAFNKWQGSSSMLILKKIVGLNKNTTAGRWQHKLSVHILFKPDHNFAHAVELYYEWFLALVSTGKQQWFAASESLQRHNDVVSRALLLRSRFRNHMRPHDLRRHIGPWNRLETSGVVSRARRVSVITVMSLTSMYHRNSRQIRSFGIWV